MHYRAAPAANDVEIFEGDAVGINLLVAAVALCDFTVLGELLLDRAGTPDIRLNRWHIGWWRRSGGPQKLVEYEHAAHHGRGRRTVGRDIQKAGLSQQSATHCVRLIQFDSPEMVAFHFGDAVMLGESIVQHCPVGIDQVDQRFVFLKQLTNEASCFFDHGSFKL